MFPAPGRTRRHLPTESRAISRRRFIGEQDRIVRRTRINEFIRISPLRVIGPDDQPIGVIERDEAMRLAHEAGLDLVEVAADVRPPVCKIMDYGKFKYELSKKEQKNRAASKSQEMKEIRLGRSVKIDPHDVQIRVDQARRFLMAGHKVQFTQRFRGREMQHKDLGIERLKRISEALADIGKLESMPKWTGRQASIIIGPDKVKIEAVKRARAKAAAQAAAEGKPQVEEPLVDEELDEDGVEIDAAFANVPDDAEYDEFDDDDDDTDDDDED